MNASEADEIRQLREENQRLRQEIARLQATPSEKPQPSSLIPRAEETLLDLAHVLIRDPESHIVFWNRGAEILYGFTQAEALGQVSHTLLQTAFPVSQEAMHAALWSEGEWEGELQHTCRDGSQIVVASHQVLHRDAQGNPVAILEINNEITQSKRTEQELLALQRHSAERATVLEAANHVAWDILTSQTGVEALRHIAEAARQLTKARFAALGVARPDGEGLLEFVTVGLTAEEEACIGPRPHGQGLLGLLLQRSEPLRVDNLAEHPSSSGFPPNHPPMDSFLGVPIRRDNAILGSLYLTNKETGTPFTEADEVAVEALGAHAAVAIHNWHLLSRQRALLRGLILGQEEERRSIAYDLHDGLTQYVMASHAHLETAWRAQDAGKTDRALQERTLGMDYLQHAVVESRRLVNGLRTLTLDQLGLAGALEQLLQEEKARAGWQEAQFTHNVEGLRYDFALETTVYRVAQEALNNARKHARTTRMRLMLLLEEAANGQEQLRLEIQDWGAGFEPAEKLMDEGRVGLHSMAERVNLIGGTYTLESAPGEGTLIRAVFPAIPPQEETLRGQGK